MDTGNKSPCYLADEQRKREEVIYDALKEILTILHNQRDYTAGLIFGVVVVFLIIEAIFHL